nr:extracellular serine/threonine protein CG31145 [Parasteatoda tepidariorum]XP_042899195.1 extracellular serine/threonine protein CG31145 [Parasteatoda tepidariorum]XP_042899196.1 extracellular serine/threonine protein CG31145 [Parasteatoda tepidariorum]
MKLKQRLFIGIAGAALVTTAMVITITTYYYNDSKQMQNYVKYVHNFIPSMSQRSLQKTVNEEVERIETPKKEKNIKVRLKKKLRKRHGEANVTYPDSNQAAEVYLSEKEYEDLLKNRNFLRPSVTPNYSTPKQPFSKKGLKSRFIRECININITRSPDDDRDTFNDLVEILQNEMGAQTRSGRHQYQRKRITMKDIHNIDVGKNLTLMEMFHLDISDQDLYTEDDTLVQNLLVEMSKNQIVHVEERAGGTQLKLIITFYDGSQAMMKPMRFDRNKETLPNHFYFVDFERHNSEIAAFHLDRILGFRRCPPVIGRILNITTEIYAVADDDLLKTFFISPAQNYCFHGQCSYYCDTGHAICGQPDDIEGSLAAYLPPDQLSGRKSWKNPWKRTYHKRRKAAWETNDDYCDAVRNQKLYNNTKRLADLIDVSIFDFLIGNMDRHHYETFKIFGNESFILHLDHGRGFGRSKHDEISILAPLYQCCFIHATTFERLLQLQINPMKLSTLMRCSMYSDPLNPILNDAHLKALDRRLQIVLQIVRQCFQMKSEKLILYHG